MGVAADGRKRHIQRVDMLAGKTGRRKTLHLFPPNDCQLRLFVMLLGDEPPFNGLLSPQLTGKHGRSRRRDRAGNVEIAALAEEPCHLRMSLKLAVGFLAGRTMTRLAGVDLTCVNAGATDMVMACSRRGKGAGMKDI